MQDAHVIIDGVVRAATTTLEIDWWGRAATIASAVVAAFTALLAWSTRNLASETADSMRLADRHHQESLAPLIVARELAVRPTPTGHNVDGGDDYAQRILVSGRIKNVGNGPALNVSAEIHFDGAVPEEPVRFFALAPNEELRLDSCYFNVLLPHGSKSFFQSEELLPNVEAKPWRLTVSYSTPFQMTRKSMYAHVQYSLEIEEVIDPAPVSVRSNNVTQKSVAPRSPE